MRYALCLFILLLSTNAFGFHLVCTGDTWNYLEPCPVCGGNVQGGMARRATAVHQMHAAGATVLVDSGGLVEMRAKATSVRDLGIQLDVLARLGYAAVNVTSHDLAFLAQLDVAVQVPLVSAQFAGHAGVHEIRQWVVVERDGVRIGITGVAVRSPLAAEPDPVEMDEMDGVLQPVLSALRPQCDLLVVLAYAPGSASLSVLDRHPDVDVVVSNSQGLLDEWERPGRVLISPVQKGMALKAVEVTRGADPSFGYGPEKRISLDASVEDEVDVRDLVIQGMKIPGPGMAGAPRSRAEHEELIRALSLSPREFVEQYQQIPSQP